MSDTGEKKIIQYDEGAAALVLMDGQTATRGEPIEVAAALADELITSGIWYEPGKGEAKPVALAHTPRPETEEELREQKLAERPEPTEAAKEQADAAGIDLADVDGTGGREGDQVTVEDVKDAAATPPSSSAPPSADASGKKQTRR